MAGDADARCQRRRAARVIVYCEIGRVGDCLLSGHVLFSPGSGYIVGIDRNGHNRRQYIQHIDAKLIGPGEQTMHTDVLLSIFDLRDGRLAGAKEARKLNLGQSLLFSDLSQSYAHAAYISLTNENLQTNIS